MAKRHHVPKPNSDLQLRLGAVVRTCRRQLGITQEELAWRANMHRTYIADIERGARNVTLRSVANLAKALQVTVGNLLSHACAPNGSGARVEIGASKADEILIVEDNETDAAMALRAFKRARVANPIRVVRSAEAALDYVFASGRYAKQKPALPRLILLALHLPRMSGLDFLRRIKGDAHTRDIPVVVLTVSKSDRMIIECGRLGAENYIVKPVAIESFVRITPKLNLHLSVGPSTEAKTRVNSS